MLSQKEESQGGLKRHHKILIGGFSTFVILVLIANSIMLYILFGKLNSDVNSLDDKITTLQKETQTKFNELTQTTLQTKKDLTSLNAQFGSINEEFSELKASTSSDFSGIIEESVKGVITIRTDTGQGTGFFITDSGYFITNAHVLADSNGYLSKNIVAINYNKEEIPASFIGYNGNFDIALLKISGSYSSLDLGNSNNLQVGEKVIAIGNPLGLQFSVTEGIVSAKDRPGSNNIEAYIQTDAALNPGNSGGPLIDKSGEVVGINNFKIGGSENIGFALESNYIREVVNDISQEKLKVDLV